ncbi:HlyD family efflux transporter periplasmic adaptor subunit [Endozoicomonadaceae bacterium StTr2]
MNVITLPFIRQDLRLLPGSAGEDGAPRWLLYDPLRSQYFTLSPEACELLRNWKPGTELDEFIQCLSNNNLNHSKDEIEAFILFLQNNNLVQARTDADLVRVHQQHASQQRSFWQWLLHNYLFIRIPLIRPDVFLNRLMPRLDWLFSPALHYLLLVLGMLGVVMVARQWEQFTATFQYFFSFDGLMLYGLTLIAVKSAHELGHALAAKRQGCRVTSMGIAFLVMFPVLYTDTTDAWKLTTRDKRLRIVTAGVRVELYLALLATFLWCISPDGPLQSVMFFIATTSWITSLLVNISPFLRFDGYYALSDWLGIENLQQRGFAMGRWYLRKMLFGLQDPLPEPLSRDKARLLIGYAWGTWIYRFFLFLGIALLVYHLFFKVLGLFLFAVEILWFIVLPVWRETRIWWQRRKEFVPGKVQSLFMVLALLLLAAAIVPLPDRIHMPAVLQARYNQALFSPEPARLVSVNIKENDYVNEGQLLLTLTSDELTYELQQLQEQINLTRVKLSRQAGSIEDRAKSAVLQQKMERLQEKQAGLLARQNKLQIRAPFAGQIKQMAELHSGVWLTPTSPLVHVVDPLQLEVEAYLSAASLAQVSEQSPGVFIADNGEQKAIAVTLKHIDISAAYTLPHAELGSEYGGEIAVRKTERNTLVPEESLYRVQLSVKESDFHEVKMRQQGTVVINGTPISRLWYHIRRIAAIAIRESGF